MNIAKMHIILGTTVISHLNVWDIGLDTQHVYIRSAHHHTSSVPIMSCLTADTSGLDREALLITPAAV